MKHQLLLISLIGLLISCAANQQKTDIDPSYKPTSELDTVTVPKVILASNITSIAKAAQLTPAQAKQLLNLAKAESKAKGIKFKILLPTYIPPGFKLEEFKTELQSKDSAGSRAAYTMIYRKSSNTCFYFSGETWGPIGGGPVYSDTLEVDSPALGKVVLGYTNFDREYNLPVVQFEDEWIVRGDNLYWFSSSPWNGCKLSIREAVKIVKSLQYLNP